MIFSKNNDGIVLGKKSGGKTKKPEYENPDSPESIEEKTNQAKQISDRTSIKKQFPVSGMSCASCAANIESTLRKQPGVVIASVNLASQIAIIEFNPAVITPQDLKEAVASAGYDLLINESENARKELEDFKQRKHKSLKNRTTIAIVLAFPLLLISMFIMNIPYSSYIMWILATPILFWSDVPSLLMPGNRSGTVVQQWIP